MLDRGLRQPCHSPPCTEWPPPSRPTLSPILLRRAAPGGTYSGFSRDIADRLGDCRQPEVLGGIAAVCAEPQGWVGSVRRAIGLLGPQQPAALVVRQIPDPQPLAHHSS